MENKVIYCMGSGLKEDIDQSCSSLSTVNWEIFDVKVFSYA